MEKHVVFVIKTYRVEVEAESQEEAEDVARDLKVELGAGETITVLDACDTRAVLAINSDGNDLNWNWQQ